MAKVGVDDLIAAQGPEVVRELISQAWKFDGHPCPTPVHLSDIENAGLGRQRLAIDLMVSSVGEIYLLPETLVLRCSPVLPKPQKKPKLRLVKDGEESAVTEGDSLMTCRHCEVNDGLWNYTIDNPELLIDLTRTPSRQLRKRLAELAAQLCPNAMLMEVKTRQTVTSFLASPKTRTSAIAPLGLG